MKTEVRLIITLIAGLALFSAAPRCSAQTNLALDVRLYAGLSITGAVGTSVHVQYASSLAPGNQFLSLTNLSLASTQQLWLDTTSPAIGRRFYRAVVSQAPTNMALIPAGEFIMGDTFGNEGFPEEHPVHIVYVSAFYMDKYLVTKSLWDAAKAWGGTNGYAWDHPGAGKADDHPVQMISWHDAVKWCDARSQMEGLAPCYYADPSLTIIYQSGRTNPWVNWAANGYRLPTEAEWEKAARGGANAHRFPWTDADTITQTRANYYSYWYSGHPAYAYDVNPTSGYPAAFSGGATPYTSPVGYFPPNAYGLYDIVGNVYEYCWDWYDSSWYSNPDAARPDTRGPASGPILSRTKRGGSWYYLGAAEGLRCGRRHDVADPTAGSDDIGFRCVRGL